MRVISSEDEISEIIKNDQQMMRILESAEELNLPDWWIGAGFLRNKWDYIEEKESDEIRDVDLVYFDNSDTSPEIDWKYDDEMNKKHPFIPWEIRNQARMHYVNDFEPYTSTTDGISHWVETATCVGVRLKKGRLKYLFCYGTDDLFGLIARPTPYFAKKPLIHEFNNRISKKRWREKWPNLKVVH